MTSTSPPGVPRRWFLGAKVLPSEDLDPLELMNKVVRPWHSWRGTATSPPPERKDSLMKDDDRTSAALPEGCESNEEGRPESTTRAAASAGRAGGSPAYPELFQPISIGGCTIRN